MPPTVNDQATTQARTTTDLITYAEQRGLQVLWASGFPERGRYYPGIEVIILRHGMTERRTLCTLAHELAHHHYRDRLETPAIERRAWRWTARLLIPDHEYAEAETMDPSPGGLARHLGVTVDVIHAYQEAA